MRPFMRPGEEARILFVRTSRGYRMWEILLWTIDEACIWARAHGYEPLYVVRVRMKNN